MFYKLIFASICFINTINASSFIYNIDNNRSLSCTSSDSNYKDDFNNNYNNEKISNSNSTSQNSIASTESNSSNVSQEFITKSESRDSINEVCDNNIIIETITEDPNIIFQKNCIIPNLDINNGKKLVVTLYNDLEQASITNGSDIPVSKINDKFCIMVNIVYGLVKTNQILKLNENITDDDINEIGCIGDRAYAENGLFTKDVIIRDFNKYKYRWIPLLYPLINSD